VKAYGKLDIVVNSAANAPNHPTSVVDVDEALWDSITEVDLKSVMLTSKYAVPEMINTEGGSIINISSSRQAFGPAIRTPSRKLG